ncbi:unnamed protein product [Closterium sp. NIES-54]
MPGSRTARTAHARLGCSPYSPTRTCPTFTLPAHYLRCLHAARPLLARLARCLVAACAACSLQARRQLPCELHCSRCPALPTCALPEPPAHCPALPADCPAAVLSALPCTLHFLTQLPCQAAAAACCCCHFCQPLPLLLPATISACTRCLRCPALPGCCQHYLAHCPALPCPAWPPPTLPCPLPSAALPCLATASAALHTAQRCPALPGGRWHCPARYPTLPSRSGCLLLPPLLIATAAAAAGRRHCCSRPLPSACTHPAAQRQRTPRCPASYLRAPVLPCPCTSPNRCTTNTASPAPRATCTRAPNYSRSSLAAPSLLLLAATDCHGHYHYPTSAAAKCAGVSLSAAASVVSGLSGGVLLLEEPVSLLLLVVPLVDAEFLGVDSSSSSIRWRLSPQQLHEWAVRWGSLTGGWFWGTRTGSVEAPGGVEATSLGACDSASAEAKPEEALHTFTLDSGASRFFFHDSTTVTPLTAPVPVTLVDPSRGLVVARGATVLPYPVAPSGLLTGLHLPSFTKSLVATSVLHDKWVTVTQPGGKLVVICTDSHTGEHLATFTRRPGSGLYSGQVAASVEVAASCSCRLLTHHNLLWHHRLGHPSLPCLHGMHSRLLVSGLPRSLPPLLRSLAPPCLPCVEGWQRAAPHSSSFPPTTAPLQTLHMDVWGPARVTGQGGKRYFLLAIKDYTRYTTDFPLQSKADVCGVLILWIRAVCLQLSTRFRQDLPVLRLHSDRGGEFCSHLLEDICGAEGIVQSRTHLASPQHNGIAEHRIGLVMESDTSLRSSTSGPVSPTYRPPLLYDGRVRLAMRQRFESGVPSLLSSIFLRSSSLHALFGACSLAFPPMHRPGSCTTRALVVCCPPVTSPLTSPSASTVFTPTAVPWYPSRLSPWWTTPSPPPPVALLPPHGPAPSGVSQVDPPPLVEPLEVSLDTSGPVEGGDQTAADTVTPRRTAHLAVPPGFPPRPSSPPLRPVAVDSCAAGGGDSGDADSGGAGSGGATSPTCAGGAGGAAAGGSAGGGAGGAGAPAVSGSAGPGGASAGVLGVGCAGGTGAGGTGATGGSGGAAAVGAAAGSPSSRRQEPLSPEQLRECAVQWGSPGGGAGRAGAVIVTIGLNVPKTKVRVHRRISAQRLQTLIAFCSQLQMTCYKLDLERLDVAYNKQFRLHDLIKD